MKRGVPDRGDILLIDFEPTKGREQRGQRPALVISLFDLNRFGIALMCPVSQGGDFASEHGFTVSLSGAGALTQGVVLCHQIRVLDYKERRGRFVETLPKDVVEEVLARVRTLLD